VLSGSINCGGVEASSFGGADASNCGESEATTVVGRRH